jgi:ketosteroid isomerase-like protein
MKTANEMTRGDLLRKGMAATALGVAALVMPGLARPQAPTGGVTGPESQIGEIYELQAAFHRAKSTQDLDLMTSLWADDATLTNQGDPSSPYTGIASIRTFFEGSGSFTHRRLSLVPSFKTQISVGHNGDHAWLYFECHDVGDYDLATRSIAADLFLAGIVRKVNGSWLFSDMTAGKSLPLSVDHYYFP